MRSSYDDRGNRTGIVLPGGQHLVFAYDAKNRLTQTPDGAGSTVLGGYDATSNLTKLTMPDATPAIVSVLGSEDGTAHGS